MDNSALTRNVALALEEERRRSAELRAALRANERITRALRESEAKFRGVVGQSFVGIGTIEDGKLAYTNAKFDEIFGYEAGELRGLTPVELTIEEDRPRVAEAVSRRRRGETDAVQYVVRCRRKDGRVVDVEIHGSAMDLDGRRLLITVVMDITDRIGAERKIRALQEQLRDQATRDPLTALHNRRYLDESLRRELSQAASEGYPVSAIMGDLDDFKKDNDRYGHPAGDEVLRMFAEVMRRNTRERDIACRYGGEEFLLVLPRMPQASAVQRADLLRQEIASERVRWEISQIAVTASFGVATFPQHARASDQLIAAADSAMYAAKMAGRNRVQVQVS